MDKHKLLAYMIDWLIDVELASSAVAPRTGYTIDYKIGICCFSALACSIKEKEQRLVGSESE
jgi:hypothetical protein